MADTITINSVVFPVTPAAPIEMTFECKRYDEPDSAYAIIESGVTVNTDGSIDASPLPTITGLDDGILYYVRQSNDCDSPREYFVTSAQL